MRTAWVCLLICAMAGSAAAQSGDKAAAQAAFECRAHLACSDPDSDGTGSCVTLCVLGGTCPDSTACPADLGNAHGVTYGLCSS